MKLPTRAWLWALCALLGAGALPACAAAVDAGQAERARLGARVTTALVNDGVVGTRAIQVHPDGGGVVRLTGRVATADEATRAVEVARAVPGVSQVVNDLRVDPNPPPPAVDRPRTFLPTPEQEFAELERTYDRLAIGGAITASRPGADLLESQIAAGPLVRIGRGHGLGPAIGFGWFGTTADGGPGAAATEVTVRPVMAGVSYTIGTGRLSVSPSLVGGYAFNGVRVPTSGAAGQLAVDVDNSLAWRPAVSIWIETTRRSAVNLSVGRVMTGLHLTFVEAGRLSERRVDGDTTLLQVGLVYKLF